MTPGLVEHLKAARAALDDAIRAAETEAVKDAGDWKERCRIVRQADGRYDVISPCDGYCLAFDEWIAFPPGGSPFGVYANRRRARNLLAACKTPPPGESP